MPTGSEDARSSGVNRQEHCRGLSIHRCAALWRRAAAYAGFRQRGWSNPKSRRAPARSLWPQLNREIMLMSTAYDLAISASVSPAARRLIASLRWYSDSLGLRPNLTPFAIARFRMKRSARPLPSGSRTKEGEASIPISTAFWQILEDVRE